jgi:glucose-6-phosphate dehydrogenase assembly protein OpcA
VIVDLTETTAAAVAAALVQARHQAGIPAIGMVATLIIVADEGDAYDALRASQEMSKEHPCRILVAIPRPGRSEARLDAEVRFLGDSGPGETVVLRLHGDLADHAESVLLPLLLPDAPVVVWWPGESPDVPAEDPVGRLAQRRITDAAASEDPAAALLARAASYQPGDTDLAWSRITSWRTLLAASLDQPFTPVVGGQVVCEAGSPSAELLARWLETRLSITIDRQVSSGPGITNVVLTSDSGSIDIHRPDGRVAQLSRPGQPDREVSLLARDTVAIIAEEMRRLDPDDVYAEVLMGQPPGNRPAATA